MVCAFLTKHVKSCESVNTLLSTLPSDDSSLQTSASTPGGGELITITPVLIIPTDPDAEEPGTSTGAPVKEGNSFEESENGTVGLIFTTGEFDQPTGSGMLPPHLSEEVTAPTVPVGEPEEAQTTAGSEEKHMTTEPGDNNDNTQGKKKSQIHQHLSAIIKKQFKSCVCVRRPHMQGCCGSQST